MRPAYAIWLRAYAGRGHGAGVWSGAVAGGASATSAHGSTVCGCETAPMVARYGTWFPAASQIHRPAYRTRPVCRSRTEEPPARRVAVRPLVRLRSTIVLGPIVSSEVLRMTRLVTFTSSGNGQRLLSTACSTCVVGARANATAAKA